MHGRHYRGQSLNCPRNRKRPAETPAFFLLSEGLLPSNSPTASLARRRLAPFRRLAHGVRSRRLGEALGQYLSGTCVGARRMMFFRVTATLMRLDGLAPSSEYSIA